MRKTEEILRRVVERSFSDAFGYETATYLSFLKYEDAQPWLKPTVTEEEWNERQSEFASGLLRDKILSLITEMDKIKDDADRVFDFVRMVIVLQAYAWMDGKEELANDIDEIFLPKTFEDNRGLLVTMFKKVYGEVSPKGKEDATSK